MTDEQISELGPAFATYLRRFRPCFLQDRTATHFDNYCRGLLSDLPRKTAEPVALACGTAVRTFQEFLTKARWGHLRARDALQQHLAAVVAELPPDPLGTVGVVDETSCVKKGTFTPGVQRQYLGCVGKVDNGIVTVHVGVAHGRFQALLDADLYLPESWDNDRGRCRQAAIPDEVRYRPKWRIAFDQLLRLDANGVRFDWLTFDEGYGSKVPFLKLLDLASQRFVAEVPVSFSVQAGNGPALPAKEALPREAARRGRRYRLKRQTVADAVWRAVSVAVEVDGYAWTLVAAINEVTAEVKYFVTNAADQPLARVMRVAFRRATVEHNFRLGKQEAGLTHYEGRHYGGLMRHLILALVVLGFVAVHTDRLRGEKPRPDAGAGVPGAEPQVCGIVPPAAGHAGSQAGGDGDPIPPAPQCRGDEVTQKAAA
jgi:SRSO17 transposase